MRLIAAHVAPSRERSHRVAAVLAQPSPVRLFIGSSSEGQTIAAHLQDQLESRDICEVDLWRHMFEPSGYALPSLIKAAAGVDFAVLIATPDDTTISRGERQASVRDNIILEFGLFAGALGLERTFLLPTGDVKLPSDVFGLTSLRYRTRTDNNTGAALNSAVLAIEKQVRGLGHRPRTGAFSAVETKKAGASAQWSGIQEAVQRFIGFDPTSEPIGDRLTNLRIAMIALVDDLDDWVGLDAWLEAERLLGATLGRQVMERAQPGNSVEQRLRLLEPYQLWAQALGSNLRHFRSKGYDEVAVVELREHAERAREDVYRANGWPPEQPSGFGLKPLGS